MIALCGLWISLRCVDFPTGNSPIMQLRRNRNEDIRIACGDICRAPAGALQISVGNGACREVLETDKAMSAKIYRPAKTAMQSGKAKTHLWVLEFDQSAPRKIDPMMGYTTSGDTRQQVKLTFETLEQAEAYAKREGIEYRVILPKEAKRQVVSYTDNFRYNRLQPWTH